MTSGPVVLDLQALQNPGSRGRGTARYAYELAVALEQGHPQVVGRYLLNPDLLPPGDLGPLLGSGKVGYAGVPDPVVPGARVLHVLSPFDPGVAIGRIWPRWAHEGGLRFCATVCGPMPGRDGSSLDDLRRRIRGSGPLEMLRAADALLTISAAQSRSLVRNLGVETRKVHTVGAGTERRFVPAASAESALLLARLGIPELAPRFVLYPAESGDLDNAEALIVAFARLPDALRNSRQLVVSGHGPGPATSHLAHRAASEGVGGQVLFTGVASAESTLRLYQAAELVCLPSVVGGHDLAVAEAMACGAVAIVSDVDFLRDLVPPEACFDPSSPAAISASIEQGLCDEAFREASLRHGLAARTTWGDVANRTVAIYEALLARPGSTWHRRRRVAIVSPFPPVASGIADYSLRLVEELATLDDLDIDCFADGLDFSPGPPNAPSGLAIYDARFLLGVEAATGGYDEIVYVLGNSEFHTAALAALRCRNGTVLAHDVRLSGLYRFAADSRAAVAEGVPGALARIYGPLLPDGLASEDEVTPTDADRYELLMAREIIGLADRFLVTSQAAARLARLEAGPGLAPRVGVVGFATEVLRSQGSPSEVAAIEPGARVVASFGIVDPIKQPDKILRCFAGLAADHPDLVVALVGPISTELAHSLGTLGEELGLGGRVFITGRVEAETYLGWLRRAEIAVQLRASFSGEASAAVGDCLACGVPMIVTDIGWMGDLPDGVAVKVPVDVTTADLAEACTRLLDDPAARQALSKGARSYAGAHTFKVAARALLDILDETSAVAG
jgi:glycosyltransferase involved in cell wall biosynthesis